MEAGRAQRDAGFPFMPSSDSQSPSDRPLGRWVPEVFRRWKRLIASAFEMAEKRFLEAAPQSFADVLAKLKCAIDTKRRCRRRINDRAALFAIIRSLEAATSLARRNSH
jgi:hypothetical protein